MQFELINYDTMELIHSHVQECEGKHTQQVVYSTYHAALTQICFGCKLIRTNLKVKEPKTK